MMSKENYNDWTNSALLKNIAPCQFASLTAITLVRFRLGQETFAIIAAASPNVTNFMFTGSLNFQDQCFV